MPIYLLHGFRWTRINIRILVILNDIEDAASEWIMAPATSKSLLDNFYKKYDFLPRCSPPLSFSQQKNDIVSSNSKSNEKITKNLDLSGTLRSKNSRVSLRSPIQYRNTKTPISINDNKSKQKIGGDQKSFPDETTRSPSIEKSIHFNDWSPIKLVEQYDPEEQYMCSQPYAYVADYLVKVDISVAIDEQRQKYEMFRTEQCQDQAEKHLEDSAVHDLNTEKPENQKNSPNTEKYWLERLRNELEQESDIGWYVVYCGDLEREIPAWALKESSTEDLSVLIPPKIPWRASLKSFFKGRRNDVEK